MLDEGTNESLTVLHGYLVQAGKPKFFVPLFLHSNTWCCLVISSNPDRFVQARPDLLPCEVRLEPHQHSSFLRWPSFAYVISSSLVHLADADVQAANRVGTLSRDAREALFHAISSCPELKGKTKRLAREALGF